MARRPTFEPRSTRRLTWCSSPRAPIAIRANCLEVSSSAVALARAMVFTPHLLLLDEPLSALDKNLRSEMQDELKRLHKRIGLTFIYVTHDQDEALSMSDRIAVMRDGRIIQHGCAERTLMTSRRRHSSPTFWAEQFPSRQRGSTSSPAASPSRIRGQSSASPPRQRRSGTGRDVVVALRPRRSRSSTVARGPTTS